ncbi:membrane-anchored ubiquitin-fold protein 4-like isoform X2 [Zingiber officinale]|uniref:membrane-anchored ubiquitin-fold protein 4-like isoform X2 n=1 Tax=Zingiber officinale TaxID=94328 RepID=UPI001C4A9013|nr:membrane-anchored ubiquitin-fold protein 4-like isoform X2 [Zingiber officinale]
MPEEDLVELNFRLYDGSDIGPIRYAASSTVAMLKERIISEWPRDKKIIPRVATDVKLICGGKMLENNKTVAQCRSPFDEISGGFITMHVVVQPSSSKVKTKKVHTLDGGESSPVLGAMIAAESGACFCCKINKGHHKLMMLKRLCCV